MRTLTQRVRTARRPLVARWELVTDAHGRTRPEMRWELDTNEHEDDRADSVTLAA